MRTHASTRKVRSRRRAALAAIGALAVATLTLVAPVASAAAPDNDSWKQATPVTALPFEDSADTTEATTDAVNPPELSRYRFHSLWYHLNVPASGRILFSATAGRYTHKIFMYKAESAGQGAEEWTKLHAARLFSDQPRGFVEPVEGGVDYFVALGTYKSSPGGAVSLLIRPPAAFAVTVDKDGVFDTVDGSATLLGQASSDHPTDGYLSLTLRQLVGDRVVSGTNTVNLAPTAEPATWKLTLSTTRPFKPGAARIVDSVVVLYDSGVRIAQGPLDEDTVTLK